MWVPKFEKTCLQKRFIDLSLVIICDRIIEVTKTDSAKSIPTNIKEKTVTCMIKNF